MKRSHFSRLLSAALILLLSLSFPARAAERTPLTLPDAAQLTGGQVEMGVSLPLAAADAARVRDALSRWDTKKFDAFDRHEGEAPALRVTLQERTGASHVYSFYAGGFLTWETGGRTVEYACKNDSDTLRQRFSNLWDAVADVPPAQCFGLPVPDDSGDSWRSNFLYHSARAFTADGFYYTDYLLDEQGAALPASSGSEGSLGAPLSDFESVETGSYFWKQRWELFEGGARLTLYYRDNPYDEIALPAREITADPAQWSETLKVVCRSPNNYLKRPAWLGLINTAKIEQSNVYRRKGERVPAYGRGQLAPAHALFGIAVKEGTARRVNAPFDSSNIPGGSYRVEVDFLNGSRYTLYYNNHDLLITSSDLEWGLSYSCGFLPMFSRFCSGGAAGDEETLREVSPAK